MLSLEEARAIVAERAAQRSQEPEPIGGDSPSTVGLAEALGRRLGRDVRADGPWPTTDRSAMDGFAVQAGSAGLPAGSELPVVGEALAGHPFSGAVEPGQAIRIMTGAVVPAPFDAVVPVEDTDGYAGSTVRIEPQVVAGANVRLQGSEVVAGDLLLARGTRLRAAEIGALAVVGLAEVPVLPRPRVAILGTGDEVVDVSQVPAAHQVRDSNSHALAAQVLEAGAEPTRLGIGRDEIEDLRAKIGRGLAEADVLVTIGGVSKGTHDLVHEVLAAHEVEEIFHGVRLKPGKPTWFGRRPGGAFVFGLPGNPASCFSVFDLLVRPLLEILGGDPAGDASGGERVAPGHVLASGNARLGGSAGRANRRTQAVPARLVLSGDGHAVAHRNAVQPSGDPFSMLGANGYVLIPAETDPERISAAPFVPYAAFADRLA